MIKRIAVLTSGGDAPGMNAAIRAVVRSALFEGIEAYGVQDGYSGLYNDNIFPLTRFSVSNMINRGGTFLGTARFPEFKRPEVRAKCVENMRLHGIDALIVIGGDGSYIGAKLLTEELSFPCIGIPGTIDNDVAGTDYTIGFQTALETALDAIDRIRDTSNSHQRVSLVEIMGRYCGDLTVSAAVAGGCDFTVIPECTFDRAELITKIDEGLKSGKRHSLIAITEHMCDVHELAREIEAAVHHETRATVLGHTQRGGSPCAGDRLLASRMGAYAVKLLKEDEAGRCIGVISDKLVHHDIIDAITNMKRPFKKDLFDTAKRLR